MVLLIPIVWILVATGVRIVHEYPSPLPTDELGYFAWQWSWLADGDMDPSNQLDELATHNFPNWYTRQDGSVVRVNKYPTGLSQAIVPLTAPAYGIAWASNKLFHTASPTDYTVALLTRAGWAATALWCVAGLLACYSTARRLTSAPAAAIATLGAWAGTSAFAYSWKLSLYAHGVGMSVIAVAAYLAIVKSSTRSIARGRWGVGMLMGLLMALAIVIRPTHLLLLLPVMLVVLQRLNVARRIAVGPCLKFIFAGCIGASVPFGVEAMTRIANFGTIFFDGYTHYGESFDWSSPHLLDVLVYFKALDSFGMGVIPAHPLTLAATAGLLWMAYKDHRQRTFAIVSLGALAGTVYLYGCWGCWNLGFSFGARWASDLLIFWTLGLAWMIHTTSRYPRRAVVYVLPLAVWSLGTCITSVSERPAGDAVVSTGRDFDHLPAGQDRSFASATQIPVADHREDDRR